MGQPPVIAATFDKWLTPTQALALFPEHWMTGTAIRWIAGRLEGGLILAAAAGFQAPTMAKAARGTFAIDNALWKQWPCLADEDFWRSGEVTFYKPLNHGAIGRYFGVKFEPSEFDELAPAAASQAAPASLPSPPERPVPLSRHPGGAARKDWWDFLWIEMIRRIRAGTLKPKDSAELQKIMVDWLAERDVYPGEDTLKRMKINLFKYLEEIAGEN